MSDFNALPAYWVAGVPSLPGARVRVRSFEATDFSAEITRRGQQISPSRAVALGKAGIAALLLAVSVDVILERVLVDWENVRSGGVVVAFSEARSALLNDSTLRAGILAASFRIDDDRLPGAIASGLA